jgi:hypothetical protein
MHNPSKKKLGREVKIEKAGCCKREVFSYGPLVVSTRCANFLEDVKMYILMQPLNARSQQKETW